MNTAEVQLQLQFHHVLVARNSLYEVKRHLIHLIRFPGKTLESIYTKYDPSISNYTNGRLNERQSVYFQEIMRDRSFLKAVRQ